MVFTTAGPAPGAIMIEWNAHDPSGQQAAAGMWDSHIRLYSQCPSGSGTWVWTADHDLDTPGSSDISIFTGRGIFSGSQGPVWLIGTSEHAALYQYSLVNAQNHYIGFAQTEMPYYQPSPAAPAPYSTVSSYNDPTFSSPTNMAWGTYIQSSNNIIIFGAGFYSFPPKLHQQTRKAIMESAPSSNTIDVKRNSSVSVLKLTTWAVILEMSSLL
ncbi:exo-beta-1,3-glucanase [Suillus subalutaceus]|uniref:exo-beta-1,3-glucanase n=1 Tax=Suillus subalutaceus TaxID=48586 RepID=UPI001B869A10|nr:exo-beta-1,3-glucanase [Suillus subalutaceus]KAG1834948.1 exo-beta-1,3-glucanase [Suillus subalutaceus]